MRSFSLVIVGALCALSMPTLAQKPDHGGQGKGGGHQNEKSDSVGQGKGGGAQNQKSDSVGQGKGGGAQNEGKGKSSDVNGRPANAPSTQIGILDRDRTLVRQHYYGQYAAGNCPPGLAKKDNGCLPPGQAKKQWMMGQPLPQHVVYEQLPQVLVNQLTPLPMGYQYIRVDNDVLLFSTATRMIENVVFDLSNLRD